MGGGHHRGPGGLRFLRLLNRLADRLELTDEQRAQIESIIEEGLPPIRELREQMAEARQEFRSSTSPTEFNEEAVRAQAQAQAQLHEEIMVASMKLKAQVFSVLTPEQLEELEELRELFGDRRGPGKSGRQGFGRHGGGFFR